MIHLASPTSHIPESNDQKLHTLCSAIEKSSKADTIMIDSDIVPGSKYSSTSRQTRKHSDNEQYTTPIEPKLVKPDVKPIISIKDSNSVTRLNKRFHNSPFHKKRLKSHIPSHTSSSCHTKTHKPPSGETPHKLLLDVTYQEQKKRRLAEMEQIFTTGGVPLPPGATPKLRVSKHSKHDKYSGKPLIKHKPGNSKLPSHAVSIYPNKNDVPPHMSILQRISTTKAENISQRRTGTPSFSSMDKVDSDIVSSQKSVLASLPSSSKLYEGILHKSFLEQTLDGNRSFISPYLFEKSLIDETASPTLSKQCKIPSYSIGEQHSTPKSFQPRESLFITSPVLGGWNERQRCQYPYVPISFGKDNNFISGENISNLLFESDLTSLSSNTLKNSNPMAVKIISSLKSLGPTIIKSIKNTQLNKGALFNQIPNSANMTGSGNSYSSKTGIFDPKYLPCWPQGKDIISRARMPAISEFLTWADEDAAEKVNEEQMKRWNNVMTEQVQKNKVKKRHRRKNSSSVKTSCEFKVLVIATPKIWGAKVDGLTGNTIHLNNGLSIESKSNQKSKENSSGIKGLRSRSNSRTHSVKHPQSESHSGSFDKPPLLYVGDGSDSLNIMANKNGGYYFDTNGRRRKVRFLDTVEYSWFEFLSEEEVQKEIKSGVESNNSEPELVIQNSESSRRHKNTFSLAFRGSLISKNSNNKVTSPEKTGDEIYSLNVCLLVGPSDSFINKNLIGPELATVHRFLNNINLKSYDNFTRNAICDIIRKNLFLSRIELPLKVTASKENSHQLLSGSIIQNLDSPSIRPRFKWSQSSPTGKINHNIYIANIIYSNEPSKTLNTSFSNTYQSKKQHLSGIMKIPRVTIAPQHLNTNTNHPPKKLDTPNALIESSDSTIFAALTLLDCIPRENDVLKNPTKFKKTEYGFLNNCYCDQCNEAYRKNYMEPYQEAIKIFPGKKSRALAAKTGVVSDLVDGNSRGPFLENNVARLLEFAYFNSKFFGVPSPSEPRLI